MLALVSFGKLGQILLLYFALILGLSLAICILDGGRKST